MAQLQPTLSQLLVRVRRYLNEVDEDKSFWSDNFLKQLLNSNYRLRCAELHMAFEGFFVNVATRDIVAEQGRYAWPPNFQRLHKLELVRSDDRRVPIQRNERHDRTNFAPGAGGDTYFPTYRPVGSGFELEPASNETVTNGLRIEYYGIPVELEADSDQLHPDFPQLLDELLVLDTALSAMHAEQLMEEGQGLSRTLELERARWEERWIRYIDNRMASSRNQIDPFVAAYRDA